MDAMKPVIILVRPQLGQNIGKAARAMYNFGLTEMRLVAPRDGWPNPDAGPSASGADVVLDNAQVFETLDEAVGDLHHVFATTVRPRDMEKPVVTPEQAAKSIHDNAAKNERSGFMFGPERSGLANDDILLADTVLTVPVNPEFGSLNLAQAVVLAAYEWSKLSDTVGISGIKEKDPAATKAALIGFFEQLEDALDKKRHFHPIQRRSAMVTSLRNMFQSAGFSSQQIQTLRGVIKSLSRPDNSFDK